MASTQILDVLDAYAGVIEAAIARMRAIKTAYSGYMPPGDIVELSTLLVETQRFAAAAKKQRDTAAATGAVRRWPIDPLTQHAPDTQLVYAHFDHAPPHVKRFMDRSAVRVMAIVDRAKTKKNRAFFRYID